MRLLVDVNRSPAWLPILQTAGHDALHWTAIGSRSAPDIEIMTRALEDNRVVFTHDLDFTAILAATGANGPSVIQLREQDVDPTRIVRHTRARRVRIRSRIRRDRDGVFAPCQNSDTAAEERTLGSRVIMDI